MRKYAEYQGEGKGVSNCETLNRTKDRDVLLIWDSRGKDEVGVLSLE